MIWLTGLCLGIHFDPRLLQRLEHARLQGYLAHKQSPPVGSTDNLQKVRAGETEGTQRSFSVCTLTCQGEVEEIFESLRAVAKLCMISISSWQT